LEQFVNAVFWNPEDRRLRAFWRISIQGFVWLCLIFTATLAIIFPVWIAAAAAQPAGAQDVAQTTDMLLDLLYAPLMMFAVQGVSLLSTLATVWLAGRFLDRRRFADFGFRFSRRWFLDLGFGLFLGAFLMTGIFIVENAVGWIGVSGTFVSSMSGVGFWAAIWIPAAMYLCVGISEELFSRGYQLKNLSEGLNSKRFGPVPAVCAATVLSSIFFGFLHGANPNVNLIGLFNITAAGILLALGYILTGELAISIGLHITWNFFQGNVFGFPVSGMEPVAARVLAVRQSGPEWITGGMFGPEGGVIGLAAIMLGSLLILLWVAATRKRIAISDKVAQSPGKAEKPVE
jgi:membrane protease YdiL (CAAX protease family)